MQCVCCTDVGIGFISTEGQIVFLGVCLRVGHVESCSWI